MDPNDLLNNFEPQSQSLMYNPTFGNTEINQEPLQLQQLLDEFEEVQAQSRYSGGMGTCINFQSSQQQQQHWISSQNLDLHTNVSVSQMSVNSTTPFVNPQLIMPAVMQQHFDGHQKQQMQQPIGIPIQYQEQATQEIDFKEPGQNDLLDFSIGEGDMLPAVSQSSLTNVSQEEIGIPSIEPWRGDYNFYMGSFPAGTTRKFAYSTLKNKLYCVLGVGIEFSFYYDYAKCENSNMSLRCFLRYTDVQHAGTPVRRCDFHVNSDKKNDPNGTFSEENSPVYHIIKLETPLNKKPTYFKGPHDNRFYLQIPIGKPQAGLNKISQVFKFECLQTCKPNNGVTRSPITAVIELLKDKKIVGRAPFELRVCSCPARDFMKDEPKADNGLSKITKRKKKSDKSLTLENKVVSDGVASTSGSNTKVSVRGKSSLLKTTDDDSNLEEESIAAIAKKRRISGIIPKTEAVALDDSDSDPLFSSQESTNDDAIPADRKADIRECLKMAKFILKLRYCSPLELDQFLGTNLRG